MSEIQEGQIPDNINNETDSKRSKRKGANLPVFTLGKGESFYIKREELKKLNEEYFRLFDDINEGGNCVPDDTLSYMESVMFEAYRADIDRMQLNGRLVGETEKLETEELTEMLTPQWWRRFLRRKSNQSAVLFEEKISRIAREYYDKKERELPPVQPETFEEVFGELKAVTLKAISKKLRSATVEVLGGIWQTYNDGKSETLPKQFDALRELIIKGIRNKKRCYAAYDALDRLTECYVAETEQNTEISDKTVIQLICEIIRGTERLKALTAPEPLEEPQTVEFDEEPEPIEYDESAEPGEPDEYDELDGYDCDEWDGAEEIDEDNEDTDAGDEEE